MVVARVLLALGKTLKHYDSLLPLFPEWLKSQDTAFQTGSKNINYACSKDECTIHVLDRLPPDIQAISKHLGRFKMINECRMGNQL